MKNFLFLLIFPISLFLLFSTVLKSQGTQVRFTNTISIATNDTLPSKSNVEIGGHVILNTGDRVRLFSTINRLGTEGTGGVWTINTNTNVTSGKRNGPAYGYECDHNNSDSDVAITNNPADQQGCILAISAGGKRNLFAFQSVASNAASRWEFGFKSTGWRTYGFPCYQDSAAPAVTGPCYFAQPSSDGGNLILEFVNAAGNADAFSIRQDGAVRIINNIPLLSADSTGVYRNAFITGGDNTNRLYAGNSGNGLLVTQDGTPQVQWNTTGLISPTKTVLNSSFGQGTAAKHGRVSTCTPAAGAGNSCTTSITWGGSAFADANYTATCTIDNGNQVAFVQTATKATGSLGLIVVNGSASAISSGTINCIGLHD